MEGHLPPPPVGTAAHRAYVANYGDKSVSVIDTTTDSVISTISVSPHGAAVVAVLPLLHKLYVTSLDTSALTVIDTLTNQVLTVLTLPGRTGSIEGDPATNKVYISEHGDTDPAHLPLGTHLYVMDGANYNLLKTITVGTQLQDVTLDSTNRRVFVTDFGPRPLGPAPIWVIDADTDTVLTGVTCGVLPHGDAVHPLRHRAYATNLTDNTVTVIDTITNTNVATIAAGTNPEAVGVDVSADRAIVTNSDDNTLTLIDTSSNMVVPPSPIVVGTYPSWVAVDSTTHKAYINNEQSNTVSVLNTQTGAVITTIPVGSTPIRITVVQ